MKIKAWVTKMLWLLVAVSYNAWCVAEKTETTRGYQSATLLSQLCGPNGTSCSAGTPTYTFQTTGPVNSMDTSGKLENIVTLCTDNVRCTANATESHAVYNDGAGWRYNYECVATLRKTNAGSLEVQAELTLGIGYDGLGKVLGQNKHIFQLSPGDSKRFSGSGSLPLVPMVNNMWKIAVERAYVKRVSSLPLVAENAIYDNYIDISCTAFDSEQHALSTMQGNAVIRLYGKRGPDVMHTRKIVITGDYVDSGWPPQVTVPNSTRQGQVKISVTGDVGVARLTINDIVDRHGCPMHVRVTPEIEDRSEHRWAVDYQIIDVFEPGEHEWSLLVMIDYV